MASIGDQRYCVPLMQAQVWIGAYFRNAAYTLFCLRFFFNLYGFSFPVQHFADAMRKLRRTGKLGEFVSIFVNEKQVSFLPQFFLIMQHCTSICMFPVAVSILILMIELPMIALTFSMVIYSILTRGTLFFWIGSKIL